MKISPYITPPICSDSNFYCRSKLSMYIAIRISIAILNFSFKANN